MQTGAKLPKYDNFLDEDQEFSNQKVKRQAQTYDSQNQMSNQKFKTKAETMDSDIRFSRKMETKGGNIEDDFNDDLDRMMGRRD